MISGGKSWASLVVSSHKPLGWYNNRNFLVSASNKRKAYIWGSQFQSYLQYARLPDVPISLHWYESNLISSFTVQGLQLTVNLKGGYMGLTGQIHPNHMAENRRHSDNSKGIGVVLGSRMAAGQSHKTEHYLWFVWLLELPIFFFFPFWCHCELGFLSLLLRSSINVRAFQSQETGDLVLTGHWWAEWHWAVSFYLSSSSFPFLLNEVRNRGVARCLPALNTVIIFYLLSCVDGVQHNCDM